MLQTMQIVSTRTTAAYATYPSPITIDRHNFHVTSGFYCGILNKNIWRKTWNVYAKICGGQWDAVAIKEVHWISTPQKGRKLTHNYSIRFGATRTLRRYRFRIATFTQLCERRVNNWSVELKTMTVVATSQFSNFFRTMSTFSVFQHCSK